MDSTRLSGIIAIILSVIYSIVAIIYFLMNKGGFITEPGFAITYWSIVFGLVIFFIYENIYIILIKQEKLLSMPATGIEIFHDSSSFLARLSDLTVGAESISTINFSPERGISPHLDNYFKNVHSYISKHSSPLKSFRSIAAIESENKAEWILQRCYELHNTGRLSLGCFKTLRTERLMCFHIVFKDKIGYVAFYPPVPLTGLMDAVIIVNTEVAKLIQIQFEIMWEDCIHVNDGMSPIEEGLTFLSEHNKSLKNLPHYKELVKKSIKKRLK
jgi:hypothetical protein